MTDRELLELAAKAAGYELWLYEPYDHLCMMGSYEEWNPLEFDGDALRLAVKLGIDIEYFFGDPPHVDASRSLGVAVPRSEFLTNDPYAATRCAIVRAAAEIGRAL